MKYKDVLFFFIGISGWFIIGITVLWAFFHEGWYAFHINKYGEQWFDMSIIVIIIAFFIYYFIGKVKEI